MSTKPGKFITLEGGEGVGKSTNVAFIRDYLASRCISVVSTREPGVTEVAENIRQLLLATRQEKLTDQAELLLVFAARAQHLAHVIKPALTQGQWVLCDRFTDATYAYQGGGRGLDISAIAWLEEFVQGDLRPDLTLLLDASSEIGMQRAKSRGEKPDRFESERLAFFDQVRREYLRQAEQNPGRIKIINAELGLSDVRQAITNVLDELIAC